jgi:ribosomal protein S18 acetylase RimI-like enzyme
MNPRSIRQLEQLAFRTWLPEEIGLIGGWALGATGGFTRRANSAQTNGEPGLLPEKVLHDMEAWYEQRGLPPCAKITPASPAWIDPLLKDNGWKIQTPSSVMTLNLTDLTMPSFTTSASVFSLPSMQWLYLSTEWEDHEASTLPHHQSILQRIPSAGFLTLRKVDKPVALGVCALDGPDAFLYDLVVAPGMRRQGLGKALVWALINWAKCQSAKRAVLQVTNTNLAARKLYDAVGFKEAYRYHYRAKP